MEFGYLPKSSTQTGNLRAEDQLRDAIRRLQKYGNIPESGRIDEKTRLLLKAPRCGVPDFPTNDFKARSWHHSRSKRFVIQGQKWSNENVTWRWETIVQASANIFNHKQNIFCISTLTASGVVFSIKSMHFLHRSARAVAFQFIDWCSCVTFLSATTSVVFLLLDRLLSTIRRSKRFSSFPTRSIHFQFVLRKYVSERS